MYRFHASIHARPDDCLPGRPLKFAGTVFPPAQFRPSGWAIVRSPDRSKMWRPIWRGLPRMYIEPDGSFVWVSSHEERPWQIDGNLYDHLDRVRLVDVKGGCPVERFDQLLTTLGWPGAQLVFQLVRAAVFLDEPEFRRWALLQRGEA